MRSQFLLFSSVLAFQALASAQSVNNRHLFWPEEGALPNRFFTRVSAATRVGGSNAAEVECLSDVSAAAFRGIGASDASTCRLTGQIYMVQDQDQTTGNPFKLVVRSAVAPDGLPDGTAAGAIAISGVLNTPIGSGTGGIAWQFTSTWTTPVTVPCENGYYVGVSLLPQLSATDYTLTWTASTFAPGATPPSTSSGDNPRVPAPKWHACRVDQPAGTASRTTSQRTLSVMSLTDMPLLNIGNEDGSQGGYISFGIGGLYPAIKAAPRDDGLVARVEDISNAGGVAAVFLSSSFLPGGINVGGIAGALWVNPATLINTAIGAIPAAAPEVFQATMLPPGSIPASAVGVTLTFTALTFGTAGARLSNAQAVSM